MSRGSHAATRERPPTMGRGRHVRPDDELDTPVPVPVPAEAAPAVAAPEILAPTRPRWRRRRTAV
ncbi:MAG: hypothetical protein JWM15_2109, partial [Cryptosporangiaceae bacterium]|nr:hypothetical protein [Cryptosporangiaceae bacterium]